MKVLIYTHEFPPFLGGLATTSVKLARGLNDSGIDTVVLAPGYGRSHDDPRGGGGARVLRMPRIGAGLVSSIPWADILLGREYLKKAVAEERPDVVLFITEEAEAAGGLLPSYSFAPVARVAGSGITTCFHGRKPFKRLMSGPMRRLYENSPLVIAVSESTKSLLEGVRVPSEKIRVIYNGVEDELLSKKADPGRMDALREKHGIPGACRVLVTVARLLPRKGQDTVIKAMPAVLREFPNAVYMIVGEGRYAGDYRRLAEEKGIADHVIFTGGVEHGEVADYLDLSDVFVMPNRFWNGKIEGLPNAILEAGARSKPVIAGNHGGSVEAVEDGVTGLLVDPEDAGAVSRAILALLKHPARSREMGGNGRRRILANHTVPGMIAGYAEAIRSAAGKAPHADEGRG